jgi:succinyl-diaminopimelate desuccinylase
MAAGIPAVEFGPHGAGHHGPDEWVSASSLARYRRALVGFVRALPMWLERTASEAAWEAIALDAAGRDREHGESDMRTGLKAIDGGLV